MDINELTKTEDYTAQYSQADISDNKVMAILAYIGFLFLVPMFAAPNSKYARFHVSQGLTLFIVMVIAGAVGGVLSIIPIVGLIFGIIFWAVDLVGLVLMVLGIINAANGQAKELPIIGKVKLIK